MPQNSIIFLCCGDIDRTRKLSKVEPSDCHRHKRLIKFPPPKEIGNFFLKKVIYLDDDDINPI